MQERQSGKKTELPRKIIYEVITIGFILVLAAYTYVYVDMT